MLRALARLLRWTSLAFGLLFLLPSAASAVWWSQQDRPASWRAADWGSSGLLPPATEVPGPVIHILAARTGGAKGAVSVHSWIVLKRAGDPHWTRHEVVGWGNPVRRDAYAADANWYSNPPKVVGTVTGADAALAIPQIERAITTYPWADHGAYTIFPGPNSNTFVAHILRAVPDLDLTLPPHAVGRDWLGPGLRTTRSVAGDFHLSANGLAGLSLGPRAGVELHLLGQAVGVDLARPALKLPAIGRVDLSEM
ncbi:MAG: DUF3750 domain-containing protein [Pseudomonadota bacterium]